MPETSNTSLKSSVFKEQTKFNQLGQRLASDLLKTDESITEGLAQRLHKHAENRLSDAGFKALTSDCQVEVYTMDADSCPSSRSYCVKFTNSAGGYVEVVGILTRKGWPTLDHGFAIGSK